MKEHILITGGAGFIGSHLTDILIARGYRVRIFDNLLPIVHGMGCAKPAYLNPLAEFVKGDIREFAQVEEALDGIDAVYHLAALTGVGQSMYEIKDYVDVNISGTSNLLQAIVNNKTIKKIILASSRAVYGEGAYICDLCGARFPQARTFEQLNQGKWDFNCITCNKSLRPIPTSEEKPLDPISIYGITKKVQEELFRCAGQAYHIPFVILRYFNVYGERQSLSNPYTGIIPLFITAVVNGLPPPVYEDGRESRDFVHVSDVVGANLLALNDEKLNGTVLNVGTQQSFTIFDIAQIIIDKLRSPLRPEIVGKARVGDIRHCIADMSRIHSLSGYRPAVSFDKGISELLQWILKQKPDMKYKDPSVELGQKGLMAREKE